MAPIGAGTTDAAKRIRIESHHPVIGEGMLTQQQLDSYLGQSIAQICQNGYSSTADNHCAHFVAHVLGYSYGVTCRMMGSGKAAGATLRVQELFPKCPAVGPWSMRPRAMAACLVFITRASN